MKSQLFVVPPQLVHKYWHMAEPHLKLAIEKGSGEFERNSILNTDDQRIQLRFAEALQVGASEFVVPSIIRTKMKLIRVKY